MAKRAVHRAIDNSRRARRRRRFTHYVPPERPPSGTYDPGIDAQVAAAERGLGDLQADTQQGLERGSDDYLIATGERGYQTGQQMTDLFTRAGREKEDFAAQTAERNRLYGIQAVRQLESSNAAGLAGTGGYADKAAKIRAANQGREQQAADVQHNRVWGDIGVAGQRVQHAGAVAQGQLDLGWGRQTQDAQTALQRAQRENVYFGEDAQAQRFYGATASGLWEPPVRPRNERRVGNLYYRRVKGGAVLENGRAITRAQLAAMRRRARAA